MALLNLRLRHRDTISLCLVWPFLVCLADNVKKNPRIARTRFGELLFLLRVVSKKKKEKQTDRSFWKIFQLYALKSRIVDLINVCLRRLVRV